MRNQSTNPTITILAILLMLGLFLGGVADLFLKRFQEGDLFPAYSSLRSDPLGCKVLAQSFAKIGKEVDRNYKPLSKLDFPHNSTLVIAGAKTLPDRELSEELLEYIGRGNRLVISLTPVAPNQHHEHNESCKKTEEKTTDNEPGAETSAEEGESDIPENGVDEEKAEEVKPHRFSERLGFATETTRLKKDETGQNLSTTAQDPNNPDISVPWHSARFFSELDPAWQIILQRDGNPVLIGRSWEAGAIFLASDSYFLSNEAMWKDRQSPLLAGLFGENIKIIFDETHHGIQIQKSISGLMRQFNLHGVILGLVLLAGLFIWRNAMPLLSPINRINEDRTTIEERDKFSGLVNIIRRNPPKELLPLCLKKFADTHHDWWQKHPDTTKEMTEIATTSTKKTTVENYNKISSLLKNKPQGHQK